MKVILLKNVPKVGQQYDVKNVADGFAINKLFPKKLAELATPGALKKLEDRRGQIAAEREQALEELVANIEKIEKAKVLIGVKANNEGGLFAAVDESAIAEALSEATGLSISDQLVKIAQPIKSVGNHEAIITLGDKEAKIVVEIMAVHSIEHR